MSLIPKWYRSLTLKLLREEVSTRGFIENSIRDILLDPENGLTLEKPVEIVSDRIIAIRFLHRDQKYEITRTTKIRVKYSNTCIPLDITHIATPGLMKRFNYKTEAHVEPYDTSVK